MLTVFGVHGAPGASTLAMHLAAHWASSGREVLLIEADPDGGSLSHNLGIQFTPGSASFVVSNLPVSSNHLVDHAQDVLFENLHVMPSPASPNGARDIFKTFSGYAEDLRSIAENEMAVIVDGGRITSESARSALASAAAGVVVVCRDGSNLYTIENLREVVALGPDDDRPQGCVVTIGKSAFSADEWQENSGLTFCGAIDLMPEMGPDLSPFLKPAKRASKKWRNSLDKVGERLYQYANPPVSNRPRSAAPHPQSLLAEPEASLDAGAAAAAASWDPAAPSSGWDPVAPRRTGRTGPGPRRSGGTGRSALAFPAPHAALRRPVRSDRRRPGRSRGPRPAGHGTVARLVRPVRRAPARARSLHRCPGSSPPRPARTRPGDCARPLHGSSPRAGTGRSHRSPLRRAAPVAVARRSCAVRAATARARLRLRRSAG